MEFYFDFHAEKITTLRDAVEVENDKNVLFRSRYVVNAAGLHADEISRLMGDDSFSISGRKGEYMLLDRAASGFVQRVIFQAPSRLGKGVLVSPTVDENAFVGPTAVDNSGKEDTSVTQEGLDFLKATGRRSMPGVPLNQPITAFAVMKLWEDGKLDLDAPVAAYLPEFGDAEHTDLTIRQLLCMTSGYGYNLSLIHI